jgi:ribonucleoside-diphosphate reductase alpha chain
MRRNSQENLNLKKLIFTPSGEKPRFRWESVVGRIEAHKDCDVLAVARELGEALTNVCLVRGEADIFTQENKDLIRSLVADIAKEFLRRRSDALGRGEIDSLVEEVLVRNKARDIARGYAMKRRAENESFNNLCNKPNIRLIRRNNQIVPWNEAKIKNAVTQAFLAVKQDPAPAARIAEEVTKSVIDSGLLFAHIEDVQDCVQEELMAGGFFRVAEAYILYRSKRSQLRDSGQLEDSIADVASQESIVLIRDENGKNFLWDGSDLQARISFAHAGIDSHLTNNEIVNALRDGVVNEMDCEALRGCVIENAQGLIEKDPGFAIFAARIQLSYLYEDIFGWHCSSDGAHWLQNRQRSIFAKYVERGVQLKLLHGDMLNYDLDAVSAALDVRADLEFDAIALQSLVENYLLRDSEHAILETPQMLWMRVAMGVFLGRRHAESDAIALYELLKERRFCLSTPTLYYAGTPKAQMMASYVYHISDDLESIMARGIADNAFISKWGGGIGGSWTNVRGRGMRIKGTRGDSPGIIPFLQLHQHQLAVANQGMERRRGRGLASLEAWHCDVQEFIDYKKKIGGSSSGNGELGTVLWIPDLFMKRLEGNADWTLFNPEDVGDLHDLYGLEFEKRYVEFEERSAAGEIPSKKVSTSDLWQKIMQRIFETGYPKIAFKDTCNRANMCKNGVIHAPNLCLEHTLNTSPGETAVCNTGSLDIGKHLCDDGSLDVDRLRNTVRIAVRALDAMIDVNYFPTEASKVFAQKYRAIGLGVMGFQNALYHKSVPFGSPEALEFGNECFELVAYETIGESVKLAKQLGACPVCDLTEWKNGILPMDFSSRGTKPRLDWDSLRGELRQFGIRNAYLNANSPTRKISRLMGCFPGLAPATRNVFTKELSHNREMMIISQELVKTLKRHGFWNKEIHKQIRYFEGELAAIDEISDEVKNLYCTAFMIESPILIEHAAICQRWIDQSQALRLFLAAPNLHALSSMFVDAWTKGIKAISDVKSAGFALNKDHGEFGEYTDGASAMISALDRFRSHTLEE